MEGPLSLDARVWHELSHAYGPADDIPDLLRALANFPDRKPEANEEPWFSLWSALAHQGDVFTASYAAAEHIAIAGAARPANLWFDHLHIIGWIEHCRLNRPAPAVPDYLSASYLRAKEIARGKLIETLASNRTLHATKDAPYLLDSIAALSGWPELSRYIEAFPDGPND